MAGNIREIIKHKVKCLYQESSKANHNQPRKIDHKVNTMKTEIVDRMSMVLKTDYANTQ